MLGVPTATTTPRGRTWKAAPAAGTHHYNGVTGERVTVRVPTVLTKCKVMAAGAVGLMGTGQVIGSSELRGWALLMGIFAAAMCIRAAIRDAAETIKEYIRQWSHQTFEDGFKGGVEQGRAMEASERFIDATQGDGN